jgi:hypothetical protein
VIKRSILVGLISIFLTACATLGPEIGRDLELGMSRLDVIRVMGYPKWSYTLEEMLILEYVDFMVHNSWNPDVSTYWVGLVDDEVVKIARADIWKKEKPDIYQKLKEKRR